MPSSKVWIIRYFEGIVDARVEGHKARAFDVLHREKVVLAAIEYGVNRRLFRSRQWCIIYWLACHHGRDVDCCLTWVGGEVEWEIGE